MGVANRWLLVCLHATNHARALSLITAQHNNVYRCMQMFNLNLLLVVLAESTKPYGSSIQLSRTAPLDLLLVRNHILQRRDGGRH